MVGFHLLVAQVRFCWEAHAARRSSSMHFTLHSKSRIVLWQHVGGFWPLGNISKRNWPSRCGTQTQNSELVCLPR